MSTCPLQERLSWDQSVELDAWLRQVPARSAVYLLADADDRPIQILCAKNLRASLRRRLGGAEPGIATRRVDYRQMVHQVSYTPVDSAFEADLVLLASARRAFPETYRSLVGLKPAWFVHVDAGAAFPRYRKTTNLTQAAGECFGPVESRESAQRLVELMEDWFDLCRYYDVLIQAPGGRACAYKEMGRCPAPCDGSISLEQYRQLVQYSMTALDAPAEFIGQHEQRMLQAAGELRFESAGRIRKYLESLGALRTRAYRHLRRLSDFRFLSLQRGPRAGAAKLFLITPARIDVAACLLSEPTSPSGLITHLLELADQWSGEAVTPAAVERIAVATRHLFAPRSTGVMLPLARLNARSLQRAYHELMGQETADSSDEAALPTLPGAA